MKHLSILLASALLVTGAAHAADVTVGIDNSSNCAPFGCGVPNGLTGFQEIYASSQFSGLTSIGSVSFTKDSTAAGGATLDTMTFNLSFYAAATSVSTFSSTPASNRGTLLADFGNFTISGPQPDVLTFASLTAFTYNPLASNLLMELTIISDTVGGSGAAFQSDIRTPAQGAVTRRLLITEFGNFAGTNGLVTTFSSATATPLSDVPEPATWGMFIGGFGLIGGALRRKKAAVSFA